ncbi:MAG: MarR family transcriptional regulator [Alkalinema sp. RL_2_19]|nr:MarR family transcriptional regulator [Alkalinema sp. RL_2_19]
MPDSHRISRISPETAPGVGGDLTVIYREGLSQQELAKRLTLSQPTVSRRLKKAEAALLEPIVAWIQSEMNEFPSPDVLTSISMTLRDWLPTYYRSDN